MKGQIIKIISNDYFVSYQNKEYICKARGVFRNKKITPLVGDFVKITKEKNLIEEIMKRKNELIRPPIANIDEAIILVSCKEPNFSSNLLDKMLVVIEYNNVVPVICFTKYDLLASTREIDEAINYYKSIGYKVFINDDLTNIESLLKGKLSVLTGQTGVGKSSLLNSLKKGLKKK